MTHPFDAEFRAIAGHVAAGGKTFSEETITAFEALYGPLHARAEKPRTNVTRDIAYGPHAQRHLLDVHTLAGGGGDAKPIVIFFHGGGLVRGTKDGRGPFFGNIADFFAANGCVGINATYRLAPEIGWPEGGRDVGAACAWARAHGRAHGGDPDRIVLVGHSAGATHVSNYVFRPELHPASGPGFAGAILMSGVFAIDAKNPPPNHRAYYGEDASKYAAMQTLGNAGYCKFPLLVTLAEYDPVRFETGSYRLLAELIEKGAPRPLVHQFIGHNHISPGLAIGAGDAQIEDALLAFLSRI